MRLTAAEKREVIRLVESSDLSVRRTLRELGVHRVDVLCVVSPIPRRGRRRGKIERYHRSMKNVVNSRKYFSPWELERALTGFVETCVIG